MVRSTKLLRERRIGQIAGTLPRAGDRLVRFRERTGVEIVQHDGSARRGELLRDGASDTPARAGDQCDFRFQREHGFK